MKKILIAAVALIALTVQSFAREDRALFHSAYMAVPDKAATFKPGGEWFPYPAYSDRAAWDKLTEGCKDNIIKMGEKYLDFQWVVMPASAYLEYEKTRDRGIMHKYDHINREALSNLILAELAEGKGRFLMKVLDGLWYSCERTAWSHGQHTGAQKSRRVLPTPTERVVSLISATYSTNVAIAWHFFHEAFDKMDPSISKTILHALEINCFEPYMNRDWGWMGLNRKSGQKVNNWNCYCNYFTLVAFLLADQNHERLLKAIDRCTYSFDQYMDFCGMDGACEEGSFYWTMATAKVYEFAHLLADASNGQINVIKDEQVKNMSSYMVNCYIGDGWIADVSDADARIGPDVMYRDVFFRYGYDAECKPLENLAVAMTADPEHKCFKPVQVESLQEAREMYRSLESLRYNPMLQAAQKKALEEAGGDWNKMVYNLTKDNKSYWYPDTQFATLREGDGWYVGAKGGHNAESHGHPDVGSGIVFVDNCPVFIDPGVETYSATTFSGSLRSKQWWAKTEWHNLPLINGMAQAGGRSAAARDAQFSKKNGAVTFKTDIAGAYPEEAAVKSWVRTYTLAKNSVTITDNYKLAQRKTADELHFSCDGEVALPGEMVGNYKVQKGELVVKAKSYDGRRTVNVKVTYPASLTPSVETIKMTDPRFIAVWHDSARKITFTSAQNAKLSNQYVFKLTRL